LLCVLTSPARLHSQGAGPQTTQGSSTSQAGSGQASNVPASLDRDIADVLLRLETALGSGDPAQYLTLVSPSADRAAAEDFARAVSRPGATRAVVRERDRAAIGDTANVSQVRLIVEVFIQSGPHGSVGTWRLDLKREAQTRWLISAQDRLTTVDGLHRLELSSSKQYRINNLVLRGEDLTLTIPQGTAFVAEADGAPTAFVLMGQGEMKFSPKPGAEKGQIRLFAGEDVLRTPFNIGYVRLNSGDMGARFSDGGLIEERVNPSLLARAREIFDEEVGKSFILELSDLSRETWSLVPPFGDMLLEVRTGRFGTLTYTQANGESEDISLFDRRRRRNISSYASERKLATRARFYSDNDEVDYDVLHYDIQSHFSPEREWLEGRTVIKLKVKSFILGTLTLRLAESLVVQSITSPRYGRLLSLRVKGQNSVLVNLPIPLARDDELVLAVTYAGRLTTATPEREVIDMQEGQEVLREVIIAAEPRMLYTNRSYWYPQSTVTDYATASMRLTVPDNQMCVATGAPANGNPVRIDSGKVNEPPRHLYVFTTTQPARYLAVVVTRLTQSASEVVRLSQATATLARNSIANAAAATGKTASKTAGQGQPTVAPTLPVPVEQPHTQPREGVYYDSLDLTVTGNPRQAGRIRSFMAQTSTILSRYADIVGDLPYPSFNLALVDDPLPGGHSPAYFALLHQPLPTSNYTWRNDPVSFDKFPQFFLAHELAHQFWGDAIGGENYHEQWISEGFAQFFALLHAEASRSPDQFEDILRQMRRTSITYDRYGPIWLGYRLGHLQGDSRVFRALVYNKSALVLHMLRRMMGDDAFFRGLRRFYLDSRFSKVGTDDVKKAFEKEYGQPLDRFFERWIMNSGVPQVVVTHTVSAAGSAAGGGAAALTSMQTSRSGGLAAGVAASPSQALNQALSQGPNQGQAAPNAPGRNAVTVKFEQKGEIFDFPITVRLRYANGEVDEFTLLVTDRVVEHTLPLKGELRSVQVNEDDGALVEVVDR
jgi:hypothetical protein